MLLFINDTVYCVRNSKNHLKQLKFNETESKDGVRIKCPYNLTFNDKTPIMTFRGVMSLPPYPPYLIFTQNQNQIFFSGDEKSVLFLTKFPRCKMQCQIIYIFASFVINIIWRHIFLSGKT